MLNPEDPSPGRFDRGARHYARAERIISLGSGFLYRKNALHRAGSGGEPVSAHCPRVKTNGHYTAVNLSVHPLTASQAPRGARPVHAPSQRWQSHVTRFR